MYAAVDILQVYTEFIKYLAQTSNKKDFIEIKTYRDASSKQCTHTLQHPLMSYATIAT